MNEYCAVFWRYSTKQTLYGDSLENVVERIEYITDEGDAYSDGEYHRWDGAAWQQIDKASVNEATRAVTRSRELQAQQAARTFAAIVNGPMGDEEVGRFTTREAAEAEVAGYPCGGHVKENP